MKTKSEIKNNLKSNVEGWNWKQNLIRKMIQKKFKEWWKILIWKLNKTKWWGMKLKKKNQYNNKKIAIKKIKTKFDIKNKWKDTLLFWQGKERKKERIRKKKFIEPQLLYHHVYMSHN
jgi:hypothetical protein